MISTKGRYAVRLMIDIAEHTGSDENITIKEISQRQGISIKYLERIVSSLCKANMLKGIRGANGGYKLIKPPSEYTIGEIIRAADKTLCPVACLKDKENKCPRVSQCKTVGFWSGLEKAITDYVDDTTLEDLVNNKTLIND